jgi:hypothetical protein
VRRFLVALAFCFCSLAVHGQKTRFGQDLPLAKPGVDYPIKVHISGVHYRGEYIGSDQYDGVIYADAIMNGMKVELKGGQGVPSHYYKLSLGDHQARLLKDSQKIRDTPIFQEYEVVLPDRTIWRCTVTGILE